MTPKREIVYGFALVLGLIFGLSYLLLKYVTYNDIVGSEDLLNLLPEGTNYLGGVPHYKKKMKYSQVVVTESSKSRLAEAIRSIRANMSFVDKNAKVMAISSSVSGEGKTFVALNLAGMLAVSGKKTIVIDLDLRKPKVHHGFDQENISGMSNIISDNLDNVIRKSHLENLAL